MQIKVKAVNVEKPAGKKYNVAEVIYANERGETKSWKLYDFANPSAFGTLKDASAGDTFDVITDKDDKGYTQWKAVTKADEGAMSVGGATPRNAPVKSTYETSEERAIKQRLIVKQSCLAQAINVQIASGSPISFGELVDLANDFVEWVYDAEVNVGEQD